MKNTIKNIYARLGTYAPIARVQHVLERTPAHALHWYALLILGLIITVANVAGAWFAFSSARLEVSGVFTQDVTAETINRENLREVLDAYRAQRAAFEQDAVAAPDVIDPGE